MGPPNWLRFAECPLPSPNTVVIAGSKTVLVDTGYGTDLRRTESLLVERRIDPAGLWLVVNTHYHSDHVGGNAGLQGRYGVPVAAHRWDAEMVNRRDPEVCSAEWLDQPVEPYRLDLSLSDEGPLRAPWPRHWPPLMPREAPGDALDEVYAAEAIRGQNR